MKPSPAPEVSGNTPWEKLDNAVRAIFKVPKEAILREEERLKLARTNKRAKPKAP